MLNWDKVGTVSFDRPCGECTKCCDGTLIAEVLGQQIGLGISCKYLKPKCTIYPIRPKVCKEYLCEWKFNNIVPKQFHPYRSNVIMHRKTVDGISHLKIFDFNKTINQEVFDWAKQSVDNDKIDHIRYSHYQSKYMLMPEVFIFSKDEKIKEILK